MKVISFYLDEKDAAANTFGTEKSDNSGRKAALVKIETNEDGFTLESGKCWSETDKERKNHQAEIWFYVSPGAKYIRIQHQEFGTIKQYFRDFGINELDEAKTYKLKLSAKRERKTDCGNKKTITFRIIPDDAKLYVDGGKRKNNGGEYEEELCFGDHYYTVQSTDYHETIADFKVDSTTTSFTIALKPKFGWLQLHSTAETAGAKVVINDTIHETLSYNRLKLPSGKYNIRIHKPLYKDYHESFEIRDSQEIVLTPILKSNYADITINVESVWGNIYVDGIDQGLAGVDRSYRLEAGPHSVEVREEKHYPSKRTIEVYAGQNQSILLDAPKPIQGSIKITSEPALAEVWLDGKKEGTTPFQKDMILIGAHKVELKKQGYQTLSANVEIKENRLTEQAFTLSQTCNAVVNSTPSSVYVKMFSLPTKLKGGFSMPSFSTPHHLNVPPGYYRFRVTEPGYAPYIKYFYLDGSVQSLNIKLKREYIYKYEFYLGAAYDHLGISGLTANMGGYIYNINVEAAFAQSLFKSEKIYWNDVKTGMTMPFVTTYRPMGFNVRMGYGFRLFNRMRLTPQVGFGQIWLKETISKDPIFDEIPDITLPNRVLNSGMAQSITTGFRLNFTVVTAFGIFVAPEYRFRVGCTPGYKALADISRGIKQHAQGFSCQVGLYVAYYNDHRDRKR